MSFKSRVHITSSLITSEVPYGKLGSYAVFYIVGGLYTVTSRALAKPFNKKMLREMRDAGVHIFVKAGTLRMRQSTEQNSYTIRVRELQSEMGKLHSANGNRTGLSTVTYLAYEKLTRDQNNHCFMVMLPLDYYNPDRYDSYEIEGFVEETVAQTYGCNVDNSHSVYTPRDTGRWGTSSLKFKI